MHLGQMCTQTVTRERLVMSLPVSVISIHHPDQVCLPEAAHCAVRKNKGGATQFQDKTYWFNWNSDEQILREGKWNWFTARNYCRKMCMDLVSVSNVVFLLKLKLYKRFLLKQQMSGTLWVP